MAIVLTDDKHYKDIANSIRNNLNTEEVYKPEEMSSKVSDVRIKAYNKGLDDGRTIYYNDGYNAGKQAERDTFWDSYQQNGNRTYYAYAFGYQWTNACFRPKHDMKPTNATHMFDTSNIRDVQECLDAAGTELDFSNCTNFDMMITGGSAVTRFGTIDTRGASSISGIFNGGTNLQTVDLFILKEDASQTQGTNRPFASCSALKNITIQGKFGFTFSMEWCPLSKASIISVFNALSTTTTGKTVTFKTSALTAAFGELATSQEWLALVDSRPNWTISLA